jgi:hypothetical protein
MEFSLALSELQFSAPIFQQQKPLLVFAIVLGLIALGIVAWHMRRNNRRAVAAVAAPLLAAPPLAAAPALLTPGVAPTLAVADVAIAAAGEVAAVAGPAHDGRPELLGLARYPLGDILGVGTYGIAFMAEDRASHRPTTVVVKRANDPVTEQQRREVQILRDIGRHENVVQLLGEFVENDRLHIVMEYAANGNLTDHLRRAIANGMWQPPWAVQLMCDIVRGIEFAHSKGIVHRDIKPANILVSRTGAALLADFGGSRPVHLRHLDPLTHNVGTPIYMSPEVRLVRKQHVFRLCAASQ